MVGALTPLPWPIGDGCAALLLGADGPGRFIRMGSQSSGRVLDGGGVGSAERSLARAASDQRRLRSADLLGSWWPTGTLAALPQLLEEPPPAA